MENYDSDYSVRLATLEAMGGDITKHYDSVYEIDLEILKLTEEGGGGGAASIQNVTYSQLKTLRDNSQLTKGQLYRITDYVTTTTQEGTSSAEHPFDIILIATDVNVLSETGVKVAHCANDDYFVAKPFRYYIDSEDSYGTLFPYEGTIEIDGTTYYKWNCTDVLGDIATYILTTESSYSNTPDGEDENGEYYYTSYQFAGFLYNDGEEDVPVEEYERWQDKHKCIIKTEEIDNTLYLIVGDIFLADTETYQSAFAPNLDAWEVKYCLDNDTKRFGWAQVENPNSGLGFSAIQVRGTKTEQYNKLVLGDGLNCAENYHEDGKYYIDEGAYIYKQTGTIEDGGTTYYIWHNANKDIYVLTTQSTYTNQVSGTDADDCSYYSNVYNVVGEITIDDEDFSDTYKSKVIIETAFVSEDLSGTFLYKRYEEGDTANTYAWVSVNDSNNRRINDTTIDWDSVNVSDIIYTNSETPTIGTETGDFVVVKYSENVQYISEGKGVVYYLKDEFNNEAEYDFKNVLFSDDFYAIQIDDGGDTCVFKRYPEYDEDYGSYAFVCVLNSYNVPINDIQDWDDVDEDWTLYFSDATPTIGSWDSAGEYQVLDAKTISLGYKFTFGDISEEPIDDSFKGNSNNNLIESVITEGIKEIPILDLGTDVVNYGKGGGTAYTAGTNISINSANQISCTYNYSLPTASSSTLGGIKVGSGLSINNGILSNGYSLPTASSDTLGGIKVGDGLKINAEEKLNVDSYKVTNNKGISFRDGLAYGNNSTALDCSGYVQWSNAYGYYSWAAYSSTITASSSATVSVNDIVKYGETIRRVIAKDGTNITLDGYLSSTAQNNVNIKYLQSGVVAAGNASTAIGDKVMALNQFEISFGRNNRSHNDSSSWGSSGNTLFSIGNLDFSTYADYNHGKNAFEVMQNGDVYVYGVGGYQGTDTHVQDENVDSLQMYLSAMESYIESLEQRIYNLEHPQIVE